MCISYNFASINNGNNSFSWFDVGPASDEDGQTLSFPDYVYGTITGVQFEDNSVVMLKIYTVDGISEISIAADTNFMGCLPSDIVVGRKTAVAVKREKDKITAKKVMLFAGGD